MKNKRRLVVGDIHGNYRGFKQALQRAGFDYEEDVLISLGDLCDGHSETFEVIEELLKIKNKIMVKGNHDDWWNDFLTTGIPATNWMQGQAATGFSYAKNCMINGNPARAVDEQHMGILRNLKPYMIPQSHKDLFKNQLPYYEDEKGRLFIHGGFNRHYKLDDQDEFVYWWDRDLWSQALSWEAMVRGPLDDKPQFKMVDDFSEIFIGHTSTEFWGQDTPMHAANIWNLDTGGGWFGRVTVMNIDTKDYYQSDRGKELYPEFKGR